MVSVKALNALLSELAIVEDVGGMIGGSTEKTRTEIVRGILDAVGDDFSLRIQGIEFWNPRIQEGVKVQVLEPYAAIVKYQLTCQGLIYAGRYQSEAGWVLDLKGVVDKILGKQDEPEQAI